MTMRHGTAVGAGALGALLIAAAAGSAQARFETVGRDTVAAVPGLQILTIKDNVQNGCYTVFLVEAARPAPSPPADDTRTVADAAAKRDQRLQELITEYERGQATLTAGTVVADPLRYALEGQKAQIEFESALRLNELARLEERLDRIAAAPRLAVSGPSPCPRPAAAKPPQ